MLLFGASGVFAELQSALNIIWKVSAPGHGILRMVKDRFRRLPWYSGTGFLLLTSLVLSAGLEAVSQLVPANTLPGTVYLWGMLNALVSLGLVTLLFAVIYKVLPDVPVAWGDVWVWRPGHGGAIIIGKHLIGLDLGHSSVTLAYGAAGSLALVLLWVYYSSQIMLFGAEFTHVYAKRHGSHAETPGQGSDAASPRPRTGSDGALPRAAVGAMPGSH